MNKINSVKHDLQDSFSKILKELNIPVQDAKYEYDPDKVVISITNLVTGQIHTMTEKDVSMLIGRNVGGTVHTNEEIERIRKMMEG